MTIYNILYAAAIAFEIPFIYLFLKATWPQKCCKSLLYKMTCSTLFILVGCFSIKISCNYSDYAKFIFTGLVFGWIGDLFLHIVCKRKDMLFGFGALSFLIGHVFYIKAFMLALEKYGANRIITIYEIFIMTVALSIGILYCKHKKINIGTMRIPAMLYTTILSLMVAKAVLLAIKTLQFGMPYAYVASAMLVIGSIFFIISDALLVIINFSKNAKPFKIKAINIITYFAAQILLASSVMFI
ncbi:MAG TPA: lysoplasmalogenase [Clostridia bacterium]|nr:lysoplasmalogenase [Clostridia bacterium]